MANVENKHCTHIQYWLSLILVEDQKGILDILFRYIADTESSSAQVSRMTGLLSFFPLQQNLNENCLIRLNQNQVLLNYR